MIKVKQLKTDNVELRRDISCYRSSKLAKIVKDNLDQYETVATPYLSGSLENILSKCFMLTNSLESAWYNNEEVYPTVEASKGCRSTSVGDIIEIHGATYVIDSVGFINLDDLES